MSSKPSFAHSDSQSPSVDEKGLRVYDGEVPKRAEALGLGRGPTSYVPQTPEEIILDRRVNLKLDLIILPILCIDYLFASIDKGSLGNAATNNFTQRAGLRPDDLNIGVSVLFASFVFFQPFSTALSRRLSPKWWMSFLMISWGAICALQALIHNLASLVVLRFILGMLEAGFFPSCLYLMSTLYPRFNLGLRYGLFAGIFAVAGAFSGAIAYGCFQLPEDTFYGYQWLFIITGVLTIFFGFVTFFVLPSSTATAWFFTQEERDHCVRRMAIDISDFVHNAEHEGMKARHVVSGRDFKDSLDWRKILTIVFNIMATCAVGSFGTFAPLVVKGMGYSSIRANLMTVPPFVVAAASLICFVYISDRYRQRSLVAMAGMILAVIGLAVMATSTNNRLRYAFLHICLGGAFVAGPTIVVWLANNTPEAGVRALVIGYNGLSNIASIIGSQLFVSKHAPRYKTPLTVVMALMATSFVGFGLVRYSYVLENKRRHKIVANMTDEDLLAEKDSNERRGDQKVYFTYCY